MDYREYEAIIEKIHKQRKDSEDPKQQAALDLEIRVLQTIALEKLTAWDRVYLARHPQRPKAMDFIKKLFPDFIELHGDRGYRDDQAIVGGLATFHDIPVTIIAHSKGKTVEENINRNFGMAHPEGFRKALRLAKQAEKFNRPIITIVDTAGANPGKGAEERGQAEAIAQCLYEFSQLKTVVLCLVIGEGGSGGALALSVADKIFMLENAIYSILSPEGFASILWKDEQRAKEASEMMKLTAQDLAELHIVDEIIEEPIAGISHNFDEVIEKIDQLLFENLQVLSKQKLSLLLNNRYEKFRKIGVY